MRPERAAAESTAVVVIRSGRVAAESMAEETAGDAAARIESTTVVVWSTRITAGDTAIRTESTTVFTVCSERAVAESTAVDIAGDTAIRTESTTVFTVCSKRAAAESTAVGSMDEFLAKDQ